MDLKQVQIICAEIKENIQKVIVGKDEVIDLVLVGLIGKGHILLEDTPGTGKTLLAKSLALSINGDFRRVQFTPDLLPADVTGMNIFNQKEQEFQFRPGPIFGQIILADEINRATPRTQSSLLECMEERQITIDGETRELKQPFFVIATQNPIETQGTFPLPEAQLDRFLIKLKMGYPSNLEALSILDRFIEDNPLEELQSVVSGEEIVGAQKASRKVTVSQVIREYIVSLIEKTRTAEQVVVGVSPRGSLALLRAAQVYALIQGRDYVLPDDVKALVKPVLAHRMVLKKIFGGTSEIDHVLDSIVAQTPVPTEELRVNQS